MNATPMIVHPTATASPGKRDREVLEHVGGADPPATAVCSIDRRRTRPVNACR